MGKRLGGVLAALVVAGVTAAATRSWRRPLDADDPVARRSWAIGQSTGSEFRGVVVTPTTPTILPEPGLPFGMSFWGGPGQEAQLVAIADVYENATRHHPAPGTPQSKMRGASTGSGGTTTTAR